MSVSGKSIALIFKDKMKKEYQREGKRKYLATTKYDYNFRGLFKKEFRVKDIIRASPLSKYG